MEGWDAHHVLGLGFDASPAEAVEVHGRRVAAAEAAGADRAAFDSALRSVLDRWRVMSTLAQTSSTVPEAGAVEDGQWATWGESEREGTDAALRQESAGWPITFGTPASGLAASGFDPGAIRAGTVGEVEVAAWIDASVVAADAFVFHSITPHGGNGDVDHVVIRGDMLVLIDAKRWAPGRYESMQTETGMVATRDGQPFAAGAVSSIGFLSERLCADLGWHGRVQRVIAVSSSGGQNRPVNLDAYRHPEAAAVTVDQLPALLDKLLASAVPANLFAGTVRELVSRTHDPVVRSPLAGPAGPSRTPLDPEVARAKEPPPADLSGIPGGAKRLVRDYAAAVVAVLMVGLMLPHVPRVVGIGALALVAWLAWRIWGVFVELEFTAEATSGLKELLALRYALMLDAAISLRSVGLPNPRSIRAVMIGLGASLGGICVLMSFRRGGGLDFVHLAIVAVVGGVLVLAVAVLILLPSDVAEIGRRHRDRPDAWTEAVEALRGADARAAAAALAVMAEYPEGVLADYLAEFVEEDDHAAVVLGSAGLSVAARFVARS